MTAFELDAYCERIGYRGPREPTVAALRDLHLAHATAIPFENLDILLGKPIRIDLESIQAKLVGQKRGGYCYEHNQLLAAALELLGFRFNFLSARTRFRAHRVLPRTHVLLLVEAEKSNWIADVGFGTVGLLQPIPLIANQPVRQFDWSYQLIEEPGLWVLQTVLDGEWQSLYAFSREPQDVADLAVSNYYVSTHPDSRFVQTLIVSQSSLTERRMLRNFDFIVDRGGAQTTTTLRDQDELLQVLAERFDLHFPTGTKFRI